MEIVHWQDVCSKLAGKQAKPVLALGNFDGVHLGHQKIIQRTIRKARLHDAPAGVLLFDPHPLKVLNSKAKLNLITDFQEKASLLNDLGVDYLITKAFDEELAATSPENFILQYLVKSLQVTGVVVGFDYSYGQGGKGKAADLKKVGEEEGFFVEIVPPVLLEGKVVSSSHIRKLILRGEVQKAAQLLGKFLRRRGKVIQGDKRGKILGYPTANLSCDPEMVYPGKGVYLTSTQVGEKIYFSVTNIGKKPTFGEESTLSMETHILKFNGEIYAKEILIYFLERIRPERKFSHKALLQEQIKKDIDLAYKLINEKYREQFAKNGARL